MLYIGHVRYVNLKKLATTPQPCCAQMETQIETLGVRLCGIIHSEPCPLLDPPDAYHSYREPGS
jgi:hypothetical protein